MIPATLTAIREHALADFPREACGLVIIRRGKERYIPCRNTTETASEHFQLSPQDYAAAEDQGEITHIVHSHPDVAARPSEADKVACEASGLPWAICSVIDGVAGEINVFEPSGYEAPLIGREFHHGVTDCVQLINDYYQRELGITLKDWPRTDGWWNKGQNLYLDHYAETGFVAVEGDPQRHDVLLMQIRSPVPNHAAIYLGDGQILQHLYSRLSSRDSYGGQWREATVLTLRHTSKMGV